MEVQFDPNRDVLIPIQNGSTNRLTQLWEAIVKDLSKFPSNPKKGPLIFEDLQEARTWQAKGKGEAYRTSRGMLVSRGPNGEIALHFKNRFLLESDGKMKIPYPAAGITWDGRYFPLIDLTVSTKNCKTGNLAEFNKEVEIEDNNARYILKKSGDSPYLSGGSLWRVGYTGSSGQEKLSLLHRRAVCDFYWVLGEIAEGQVTLPQQIGYARQMIWAVQALESMGILHRDIRPENFLLFPDGTVKLTDWYSAVDELEAVELHTGEVTGAKQYLPEGAFNEGKFRSDFRWTRGVELYSLGKTLLAMQEASQTPTPANRWFKEIGKKIRDETLRLRRAIEELDQLLLFYNSPPKVSSVKE